MKYILHKKFTDKWPQLVCGDNWCIVYKRIIIRSIHKYLQIWYLKLSIKIIFWLKIFKDISSKYVKIEELYWPIVKINVYLNLYIGIITYFWNLFFRENNEILYRKKIYFFAQNSKVYSFCSKWNQRTFVTCCYIWHVSISECMYYLDTLSAKVWWRYNTSEMNGQQ